MSWPVKTHIPITDSNRLYYKDTFIWDSSKVNAKFQALKSKFDRTGIPNTLTKDFDGKFDSVEENAIEETFSSDVPESKVCPSLVADVAEEKRKTCSIKSEAEDAPPGKILMKPIVENFKVENEVRIFGYKMMNGLKVSFGLDHYGEELNFRHPLLPPPIGHYWDEVFFTDARISEGESPFSFYLQNYETEKELEALIDFMNDWYAKFWSFAPVMEKADIFIGGFYAVYIHKYDSWYRCCVTDFIYAENNFEIVVSLIDWGSVEIVSLDSILLLREVYCILPRQAAWARVFGLELEPTESSNCQFRKDFFGEILSMFIVKRDSDPDLLYPALVVMLIQLIDNKECSYTMSGYLRYVIPEKIIEELSD